MKKIFVLYVFILASLNGESISDKGEYPSICELAARDNAFFNVFKRDPIYRSILEHVSFELGLEYLQIIKSEHPEFLSQLNVLRENDLIGSPITYNYPGIGDLSPTTLRYIKVAGDIKNKFGSTESMKILEIGAGYGGQCKILSDLLGFKSYTIVDLHSCNKLTKKYLKQLGVKNVYFMDSDNVDDSQRYDLVISNYAFSEINKNEQSIYLDKIIKKIPAGYMTLNFISHLAHISSYSVQELETSLYEAGFSVSVEKEIPNSHPDNLILSWKR